MSRKLAEMLITIKVDVMEMYRAFYRLDVAIARIAAHYYRNKYFKKWTEDKP